MKKITNKRYGEGVESDEDIIFEDGDIVTGDVYTTKSIIAKGSLILKNSVSFIAANTITVKGSLVLSSSKYAYRLYGDCGIELRGPVEVKDSEVFNGLELNSCYGLVKADTIGSDEAPLYDFKISNAATVDINSIVTSSQVFVNSDNDVRIGTIYSAGKVYLYSNSCLAVENVMGSNEISFQTPQLNMRGDVTTSLLVINNQTYHDTKLLISVNTEKMANMNYSKLKCVSSFDNDIVFSDGTTLDTSYQTTQSIIAEGSLVLGGNSQLNAGVGIKLLGLVQPAREGLALDLICDDGFVQVADLGMKKLPIGQVVLRSNSIILTGNVVANSLQINNNVYFQ